MSDQYTTVQIPGVGDVDFPASMSDDQIAAAAKRLHGDAQATAQKPSAIGPGMSVAVADRVVRPAIGAAASAVAKSGTAQKVLGQAAQSAIGSAVSGSPIGLLARVPGIRADRMVGTAARGISSIASGALPKALGVVSLLLDQTGDRSFDRSESTVERQRRFENEYARMLLEQRQSR